MVVVGRWGLEGVLVGILRYFGGFSFFFWEGVEVSGKFWEVLEGIVCSDFGSELLGVGWG